MTSFVKDCIAHVGRSYIFDGMRTFSKMPVEGTNKERKITRLSTSVAAAATYIPIITTYYVLEYRYKAYTIIVINIKKR